MPYFVFRINQGPTALIKHLELVQECEAYKEAKDLVKSLRQQAGADDQSQIKMIFADNQLLAEEQMLESRDKPIIREWER